MEIILTSLSKETLELLKQGLSSKEIAERQNRTTEAVEAHKDRLREKFGARNTVQLVVLYLEAVA
jgi:DNA-binding CsgD family transcriptional regulator